mgnify:CR=1 FL=1
MPPATAALDSELIVPLWVKPGSLKWTWSSIKPGTRILLVASMIKSISESSILGLILEILSFSISKSEIYFLSSQLPTYFDNFINYLNVEGFAVSSQSLDLETQFNTLIKDYGSTVGSSVVFAGQGLLRTLGHIFIIFFFYRWCESRNWLCNEWFQISEYSQVYLYRRN